MKSSSRDSRPSLPSMKNRMKRDIFISANASEWLKDLITSKGYGISAVTDSMGSAIGTHADLYFTRMGCDTGAPVFTGTKELVGSKYPEDCIYNAACTGKYFIHRLDITDPNLLHKAEEMGMIMVDVPQGYTKCSTLVVDEKSVITSDQGIRKKCGAAGIDVLGISPGHIELPGFRYGFIGGSSGRIENTIVFEGDITSHPDYRIISEFISSRGLDIAYNKDMPLTDIGSII